MAARLDWRGPQVLAKLAAGAVAGVDEVNTRIESAAKGKLYKGHGVRTGTMRRSIHTQRAQLAGTRVTGAVGTPIINPPYPLYVHEGTRRITRPIPFLKEGFNDVQPQAARIIAAHIRRAR